MALGLKASVEMDVTELKNLLTQHLELGAGRIVLIPVVGKDVIDADLLLDVSVLDVAGKSVTPTGIEVILTRDGRYLIRADVKV